MPFLARRKHSNSRPLRRRLHFEAELAPPCSHIMALALKVIGQGNEEFPAFGRKGQQRVSPENLAL